MYDDSFSVSEHIKNLKEEATRHLVKLYNEIAIAKSAIGYELEAKFIAPSQLVMWESVYRDCLLCCKVLKTLCATFNLDLYKYSYTSNFFYKSTTFLIKYNSANYTFEVTTGMKFKSNQSQIKNRNIDELYKRTESLLNELTTHMKRSLPKARYNEIMNRFETLKQQRT